MLRNVFVATLVVIAAVQAVELPKEASRAKAAKEITDYLDKSVSPCDNFFQFACGNWKNYHPLSEGKLDATGFSTLLSNINNELKEILEGSEVLYNNEVDAQVRQFYKSCTNVDAVKAKGYEAIKNLVKDFVNAPVVNKNWDESKFNVFESEAKIQEYGFDALVGTKVLNQTDKLYIGEAQLPYQKEAYGNAQIMTEYQNRIVEFMKTVFELELEDATKVAKEIIDFEKEVSNLIADEATRHDDSKYFVKTTVEAFNKKYPKVQWDKFFTQIVGTAIELSNSLVEFNPSYLSGLMELLEKSPKNVVANFMVWHTLGNFVPNIHVPLAANRLEAQDFCVRQTKEYYSKEIGVMYSRKYYDSDVQKDVEEMFSDIKKTVHAQFEKLDWIDAETKKLAFERLDAAKIEILGYSKEVDVPVASDFGSIVTNIDEFYQNVLNKLKYNTKKYRTKTVTNEDINNYVVNPASLTAQYDVYNNVLKISLGFLNAPFYTKAYPRNMKFAQLGAIMVHELLHGFDAIGQSFGVNNVPAPWWSEKATNVFNEKSKCFADQYAKNEDISSLNDNVADNGGIKYAYKTYKQWVESIKEVKSDVYADEVFAGIDYTPTQLFFLTHAQTWCHYNKPNPTATEFKYPSEYRINLPMTNFEDFAKEFECPEGSPMNPKDKCVLW